MPPTDFLEALTPDMLANLLGSGRINVTTKTAALGKADAVSSSRGLAARAAVAPPAPLAPAATAAAQVQLVFSSAAAHGHVLVDHVEQPARVDVILQKLAAAGISTAAFGGQLHELPATQLADMDEVREVHSYADDLQRQALAAAAEGGPPTAVADIGDPDGITYVTATSFEDALRAAGAATALVDTVVAASRQGNATAASSPASSAASSAAGTAAFCITRPPGHHATRDTPLGYCLLNNVALAARHAQRKHRLERVLILDFDLHHGNGTAAIFAKDPSVLFVDTHEAFSIYPPPYAGGAAEDVGEGPGRGATINIPLPRYAGERCMLSVYDSIIAPAVERFCPDIILVSAGFDAHWKDPFQGLQLRSSTYHKLAARLRALAGRLCGGRLVFLLEGGYHTEAVGESVCEVFLALLGRPSLEAGAAVELPQPEPVEETERLVAQLRQIHGL